MVDFRFGVFFDGDDFFFADAAEVDLRAAVFLLVRLTVFLTGVFRILPGASPTAST